jgi:hypothetical protein
MSLLSILGLGLSGVGSLLGIGSKVKEDDKVENNWLQNPEYKEAEGARASWWDTLQKWGSDPNYGAISPDWDNIWQTVQRQVKEYYSGGPLSTGMRDKLKASVARRNMGDQPAADYLQMASYAEEANKMKDIATAEGAKKAELSEQGRRDWLNSLMALSQQKPAGEWQTTVKSNKTSDILGAVGEGIGGVGSSMVNYGVTSDWLDTIKKKNEEQEDTPNVVFGPYESIRGGVR